MTLRRVLLAWTGLAVLGWLFSFLVWAGDEADCNEATSFICFDQKAIGIVTGIYVAMLWLAGLFVVGVVAALVWRIRTMSDGP